LCTRICVLAALSSRSRLPCLFPFCVFSAPATADIFTLSLHDALPIWTSPHSSGLPRGQRRSTSSVVRNSIAVSSTQPVRSMWNRSEEHTSELQSRFDLVCRLLLEKNKQESKANILFIIYLRHHIL